MPRRRVLSCHTPSRQVRCRQIRCRRSRAKTAAFGLSDTVCMLLAIGLLMSLSSVMLKRTFDTHHRALRYFREIQNLQNAHLRLTADAHEAVKCDAAEALVLTFVDQRQVQYLVEEGVLVRRGLEQSTTASEPHTTDDTTFVEIETWAVPKGCEAEWNLERDGAVPLITCLLRFRDDAGGELSETIHWQMRTEIGGGK